MSDNIAEVKKLVEEQGTTFHALMQKNDERLTAIEKKGAADPLVTESLNKMNDALDKIAEINQKQALLETAVSRTVKGLPGAEGNDGTPEQKAYAELYKGYLLGRVDETEVKRFIAEPANRKALSVNSDPDGGYLVTPTMSATIIKKVFESTPLRGLASVETISSDSLEIIDDHDEPTAGWVGETQSRADTNTPTIAKKSIPVHEIYASPKATQKILDDAGINIEAWLAGKVSDLFARKEATAFVSGTGVGQPRGILTYTAGTTWGSTVEQISSADSADITADGLVSTFYALKEDYAMNAAWLMNRLSVKQVRLLKEATTNAYMWQPSLQAGQPDSLLGAAIYQASDMPVPAADSLSVAFGDWKRAYQIVDRLGIRVLRDPFTDKPYIKFYTTKRVGGDVINTEAFKILKLSAS